MYSVVNINKKLANIMVTNRQKVTKLQKRRGKMSNLIEHAKRELTLNGMFDEDSDYNGMLGEAVIELIEVFSKQGHSGCSANMVSNLFNKLSRFKPISPLTGQDEEWIEIMDGTYQNKRNSSVFKDGKEGKAYFGDAYVKRTPNGSCWGGRLELKDGRSIGRCYIKDFTKMPTITIDVLEKEVAKDDWDMWIEDESQLDELAKYYDFEIENKEN